MNIILHSHDDVGILNSDLTQLEYYLNHEST